MPRVSTKFDIDDIAPTGDMAWQLAPESSRRGFWKEVVRLVKVAKDRELSAGLDRYGSPMVPIKEVTRQNRYSEMGTADPNAPPLTPAYGLSRTRAWFDGRAFADRAEFFWRNGWGKILHFHRIGAGRLPVRDVIGISKGSMAFVRAGVSRWWASTRKSLMAGVRPSEMRLTLPTMQVAKPTRKPAPYVPPKIKKIGSFDWERYEVGTTGEDAMIRRAAEAGYFAGFRKKGANRMPPTNPPSVGIGPRVNPPLNPPDIRRRRAGRKPQRGQ